MLVHDTGGSGQVGGGARGVGYPQLEDQYQSSLLLGRNSQSDRKVRACLLEIGV